MTLDMEKEISVRYDQIVELFLIDIEFLFVESYFALRIFFFSFLNISTSDSTYITLRTLNNLSIFGGFACTKGEQTHRSSCVVSPTCLPGTVLIAFAQ